MLKRVLVTAQKVTRQSKVSTTGFAIICLLSAATPTLAQSKESAEKWPIGTICNIIEEAAQNHDVPRDFFARLIWTESRFDINALSPVGAQGIAQFMPGTARERGLKDPYNPELALPASAALLKDNKDKLGNWVLAAAAYNAGLGRVKRWQSGQSQMPFETQNYIVSIFGLRIDRFKNPTAKARIPKLDKQRSFQEACRDLPILRTRAKPELVGLNATSVLPWGVQVSGNFSQQRAINSWLRVRANLGLIVDSSPPNIHRLPTPRGMRPRWAVRLGATTRDKANQLCVRIRRAGGSCIVLRNSRG